MSIQNSQSRAAFPTTSWSLIRGAQDLPDDRRAEMLNELLRRYWKPIYSFFRAKRIPPHEAEDHVQEFLQGFIAGDKIAKFTRRDTRFRSWLRTCAGNFLRDRHRRDATSKMGGAVMFGDLQATDGRPYEPADEAPEEAFTEGWRRDILDHAMKVVAELSLKEGRRQDYEIFCAYYCTREGAKAAWKQIAHQFGLTGWKEATRKADWAKGKLAEAIRAEVRIYVEHESDVDDEIRHLL